MSYSLACVVYITRYDRDLGLAGRVLVRDPASGSLSQRLVKLDKPLLRIPMLVRWKRGRGRVRMCEDV